MAQTTRLVFLTAEWLFCEYQAENNEQSSKLCLSHAHLVKWRLKPVFARVCWQNESRGKIPNHVVQKFIQGIVHLQNRVCKMVLRGPQKISEICNVKKNRKLIFGILQHIIQLSKNLCNLCKNFIFIFMFCKNK